jgi:hypothetical protein
MAPGLARVPPFKDEPGPAADQAMDRSLALRAFPQDRVRYALPHFEPVTTCLAFIFIGQHDSHICRLIS